MHTDIYFKKYLKYLFEYLIKKVFIDTFKYLKNDMKFLPYNHKKNVKYFKNVFISYMVAINKIVQKP
jgi:hypothetical protein